METSTNMSLSIEKVALKYGLLTFSGLTVYFLIMKFAGLIYITELRGFNGLIMIGGMWKCLTFFKANSPSSQLNYFEGLGLGALTAAIAVIPFAVFILFYLIIDSDFMMLLKQREDFGQYLNPYVLSFLIAFEGMVSGFIIAFAMMQYLKKE